MAVVQGKGVAKRHKQGREEARQAKRQKSLHQWAIKQAGKMRRGESLVPQVSDKEEDDQRAAAAGSRQGGRKRGRFGGKAGKGKRARTKFEEYLEQDRKITGEGGLEAERRLAKMLNVRKGKLRDENDGLAELLEGISPMADYSEDEVSADGEEGEEEEGGEEEEEQVRPVKIGRKRQGDSGSKRGGSKKKKVSVSDGSDGEGMMLQNGADGSEELVVREDSDAAEDDEMASAELGEDVTDEEVPREDGAVVEAGKSSDGAKSALAVKYVPPHLRQSVEKKSEETIRLQNRVRGLLNRLTEANVEPIVSELTSMFQVHGRRVIGDFIIQEILGACCSGPRGNQQYAAVFAAFVGGIAAIVGIDFGAKFVAAFSVAFEEQYQKEDSLALRNLSLLFSNLFLFHLLPSDLVYDLLGVLCKRFEELDVATILWLLQSCGIQLRGDDPTAMKDFILSVQQRTADLKAVLSKDNASIGKRVGFMLDTICDIKNNKRRTKEDPVYHSRLKKWLQKLRIEDVQLRAVTWSKLLDPSKKGQWWLPGGDGQEHHGADARAEVAGAMDTGAVEAEKMIQLAASQRMNTDARRAVFCIIMSSEDYLDAFEKLLRLKLPGKQDREVLRVIVDCCLQEKIFNKYYSLLASKLCHHDKNHKFTLQYCLWDQFKELSSMDIQRSANLARLVADLISSFALSMTVLKAVDFTDARTLTPKVVMHFRIFFKVILTEYPEDVVWAVFSRIAAPPELASLRDGVTLFLHQHVRGVAENKDQDRSCLAERCKLAKKGLLNVIGVQLKSS